MVALPELNPDIRTPTRQNRPDPIIDPNNVLIPRDLPAVALLTQRMIKARSENPRGELYRELDNNALVRMLCQNVEELIIALRYENDVADKCGDVANFVAFILHNAVSPPDTTKAEAPPEATKAPESVQDTYTGILRQGGFETRLTGVRVPVRTIPTSPDRAPRSYFPPDAQPDEPDTLVRGYANRRGL